MSSWLKKLSKHILSVENNDKEMGELWWESMCCCIQYDERRSRPGLTVHSDVVIGQDDGAVGFRNPGNGTVDFSIHGVYLLLLRHTHTHAHAHAHRNQY